MVDVFLLVEEILYGLWVSVHSGFVGLLKWWFPGSYYKVGGWYEEHGGGEEADWRDFFFLQFSLPPHSPKDVRGDIALVTGGGGGIGRIMAKKLAARGAVIVTVDLKEEWNKETVK